jgi:hypothetical protein
MGSLARSSASSGNSAAATRTPPPCNTTVPLPEVEAQWKRQTAADRSRHDVPEPQRRLPKRFRTQTAIGRIRPPPPYKQEVTGSSPVPPIVPLLLRRHRVRGPIGHEPRVLGGRGGERRACLTRQAASESPASGGAAARGLRPWRLRRSGADERCGGRRRWGAREALQRDVATVACSCLSCSLRNGRT